MVSPPSAGRALVAGHDVASEPEKVRLRIGVALQEAALDPKQTGVQLLRLQGRLYGLSGSDTVRRDRSVFGSVSWSLPSMRWSCFRTRSLPASRSMSSQRSPRAAPRGRCACSCC